MEKSQLMNNVWPKVTAVCAVFIAGTVGYLALSTTMNVDCATIARQADKNVTVYDTRWSLSGCQYLYSVNGSSSAPRWVDGEIFEDVFVGKLQSEN